ncbi:glycoside hydrolase family 72 protein [Aureobasidium subglaciale]|nr:glycoside hydrolase family 72 protein [Aureobasidium subglaciale]
MRFSISIATSIAFAAVASAIPTISVKGSKFFTSDGNQYFVKGIAYQLVPEDPLIDNNQCQLDASLMKTLGANAIRVYHVDPDADHKACMSTFADAGIYLFVDLDTFNTQIEQTSPHWNESQYDAFAKVMDEFQQFDNTAGFFVGNEVLTTSNGSIAAPYVKAAARDMKSYRNSKNYRNIPVGYSAADISSLRPNLQNYLACGTNSSDALDFFSLNSYEWCGQTTYEVSGYEQLTHDITSYNIPIFFSEVGCNTPKPRTFDDQAAIFGSEMAPYWSGSMIYEWLEEANNYGLINYGPQTDPTATNAVGGFTRSGTPTPISPDFYNLSNQWKTLTPSSVSEAAYSPTNSAPECPAYTSGVWEVSGNVALPTVGQAYEAQTTTPATSTSGATGTGATGSRSGSGSGSRSTGSTTGTSTGASSGTAASASQTGMASPSRQIAGMSVGLVSVMLGFIWWLASKQCVLELARPWPVNPSGKDPKSQLNLAVYLRQSRDDPCRKTSAALQTLAFNVSSAIPDTYGDKAIITRPSVEKSLHITDVLHWLNTPFGNGVFALLIQSDWRKLAFVVQAFRVQKTLRHLVAESPSLVKVCKGARTNVHKDSALSELNAEEPRSIGAGSDSQPTARIPSQRQLKTEIHGRVTCSFLHTSELGSRTRMKSEHIAQLRIYSLGGRTVIRIVGSYEKGLASSGQ